MSEATQVDTILETARLRLRPHRDSDLANLVRLAGPWDVAMWLSALPHPYTEAHGRDWIAHVRRAHAAGHPRAFAIAAADTGCLIGGAGLDGSTGDGADEPALGYWLGTPHRRRGYGGEAVAAVLRYGFDTLGLDSIRAITAPDNAPSQRVLLSCGLKKVGDIQLMEAMRTGHSHAPLFRITRRDHHALRPV